MDSSSDPVRDFAGGRRQPPEPEKKAMAEKHCQGETLAHIVTHRWFDAEHGRKGWGFRVEPGCVYDPVVNQ